MRHIIALLFCSISISVFAQSGIEHFDPLEVYKKALELESNDEDSLAIFELNRLHPADSIFYSAMTTATHNLLSQGKNEECIALCDSIIKNYAPTQSYVYYYLLNKGVAQLRSDTINHTAIETFEEAIKSFPADHLLYFNLGIAYQNADSLRKAQELFQRAIAINPYYAEAHMKLGYLSYKEDYITQAVLAYSMVLLLEPKRNAAPDLLRFLDHIVSTKGDDELKTGKLIFPETEKFADIDLIVNNYSALQKGFKIESKITTPLSKQLCAIIEMLKDFEPAEGFWSQFYIPFYQSVLKENKTVDIVGRIHTSSANKKVAKLASKTAGLEGSFVTWVANNIILSIQENGKGFPYREGATVWHYSHGPMSGVGAIKQVDGEEVNEGHWEFYHKNGVKSAHGSFKDGKQTGHWQWFDEDGRIKEEGHFANDELDSTYTYYYPNGRISSTTTFDNGEKNGPYAEYQKYGGKSSHSTLKDGQYSDSAYIYYEIGDTCLHYRLNYIDGKYDGIAYEYFSTGELYRQIPFTQSTVEGKEFTYYRNGKIHSETVYLDGKRVGMFNLYFDDGTLAKTGQYTEGEKSGEWKEFYANGNLKTLTTYSDKGLLDGSYKKYTRNGKLHYVNEYVKDKFKSYTCYKEDGTVLSNGNMTKSGLTYESFHPDGYRMSKGKYGSSKEMEGLWQFYDRLGVLRYTAEYENGKKNGKTTYFFEDSTVKAVETFVDGIENGLYYENNINGERTFEVYIKDGEKDRVQKKYINGKTYNDYYLRNGVFHGIQKDYDMHGRLSTVNIYDEGYTIQSTYYDTLGNVLDDIYYYEDDTIARKFPNGKQRFKGNYVNGFAHGDFEYYYSNGAISLKAYYHNGNRHGQWTWYHRNGQIDSQGEYIEGSQEGEWVDYNEDGSLSWKRTYKNDERHGINYGYSDNGTLDYQAEYKYGHRQEYADYFSDDNILQIRKYYTDNRCIGYSYLKPDGSLSDTVHRTDINTTMITFYPSGDTARVLPYKNGVLHGQFREYHTNGKLAETENYHVDFKHGETIRYFMNGNIRYKKRYHYGKYHGVSETYYENGQIKSKIPYIGGNRSGLATFYNQDGSINSKIIYVDDNEYDSL